jgi:dTDP-4-amino-4,6-dideoxygalactose transaminase
LFSDTPAFDAPLHVGRPNIGDRETFLRRINEMLDRRWLSNRGPLVQEFEARLESITGAKHCIALSNGTVALELVVRALGLSGEVIVPSYTFVATAHALRWNGITPVFCEVDPVTHNLDASAVEALITPQTTGIVAVHLWGRSCDTERLEAIAQANDLKLMFDAAHAFGCSNNGTMIGNFGDAEVYSFHATKFVNAFEGGAVATNSDDLAHQIRRMQNFGFAGYDDVRSLGTNGKMSEASAAMGLTSLESMDAIVDANRRNYLAYRDELSEIDGLKVIDYSPTEACNYQYIIVEVDAHRTGLTRDDLVAVLEADNVRARRYFYPGCHRMEPYATEQPDVGARLPITEHLSECVLALPNGTTIQRDDVEEIGAILRAAVENADDVQHHLRQHAITPH